MWLFTCRVITGSSSFILVLRQSPPMLIQYEFSRSTVLVSHSSLLVSHPTWLEWLFGMVFITPHAIICDLPPGKLVYFSMLFQAQLYWVRCNLFIYWISSQHANKTIIVNNFYKMPVARRQRKVEPSHRPLKFISQLHKNMK